MRFRRRQVEIAAILIALAVVVYGLRWLVFPGQAFHREMLRYLVDDVAFLFIQVLLVSLLLDGLMRRRAREAMLNKLNMIIGAFFSECGTELLGRFAEADTRLAEARADLVATAAWTPQDYERAKRAFREHRPVIDLDACDLSALRERLSLEKAYLLGLLGNQALLEHETFTDLLWAVTHVAEELGARRLQRSAAIRHRASGERRDARLHAAGRAVDRLPAAPADAVSLPLLAGGAYEPPRSAGMRYRHELSLGRGVLGAHRGRVAVSCDAGGEGG